MSSYLASYRLTYQTTSAMLENSTHPVLERFDKRFDATNHKEAYEAAKGLGQEKAKEVNKRYDCSNAQIKLERLLRIEEVPLN